MKEKHVQLGFNFIIKSYCPLGEKSLTENIVYEAIVRASVQTEGFILAPH